MKGTIPFLRDTLGKDGVAVALFGKHPAAADHLEDLGLTTESLSAFKQMLYVEGIGECMSRQVWARDLTDTNAIPYDHHLLCSGPAGWLAARLAASTDAAGRRQFPLVLALHGQDHRALHKVADLGRMIDAQTTAASAAKDLAALRHIHVETQRLAVDLCTAGPTLPPPDRSARESWLQHLPLEGNREGLWRCCHALMPSGAGAGRARVPLHAGSPWASATLWASFARALCPGAAGYVTLIWKQGQPFADVWLVPPVARVLGGMFAPEASQPLTSAIPFDISPEDRVRAETALTQWLATPGVVPVTEVSEASLLNKVCKGVMGLFK